MVKLWQFENNSLLDLFRLWNFCFKFANMLQVSKEQVTYACMTHIDAPPEILHSNEVLHTTVLESVQMQQAWPLRWSRYDQKPLFQFLIDTLKIHWCDEVTSELCATNVKILKAMSRYFGQFDIWTVKYCIFIFFIHEQQQLIVYLVKKCLILHLVWIVLQKENYSNMLVCLQVIESKLLVWIQSVKIFNFNKT